MKNVKSIVHNFWPLLFIILICLWAIKPLLVSGFFTMHDDEQIARLVEMSKVLLQSQIPPRWVPDLGFGYGYPLFNFYPPLVYYFGFLFHILGFSFITSTKIVMGLGFILSGIFMYLWTKNRFGVLAGIFAAFLYIYAPYHSVDIYVRGALSEFFSFVWIPAVFWSLDLLSYKPSRRRLALSSFFLCLVVLTHSLVMLQFMPFLFFYIIFLLWGQRKKINVLIPYFFMFGLLGFGLSAYFAIPSVLEKQYTLVDSILTKQLANYSIHFVCPSEFWNSLWGYGGSVAGCVDGLSFQVGKIQLLVSACALIIGLIGIFWKKYRNPVVIFAITMFILSLFVAIDYSKFIWDHFQPFWYIQFPWRFLLFSAIFSSFLGGSVIAFVQKLGREKLAIIICLILAGATFYQIRNDFKPQIYLPVGDNYYIDNQDIQWRVSSMSYEYVPKEVATRLSLLGTTELAINKTDIPQGPFAVVSGSMQVKIHQDTAVQKMATVKVDRTGMLQVNTYAFPGWKAFIDGKEISYSASNPLHLMQVHLTQGIHMVDVIFTDTTVRTLSNLISLVSLLIFVALLFWPKKNV